MSCMEHRCANPKCDWFMLDNQSHDKCPKCGAMVRSYFDEEGDHHPDPREDWEAQQDIAEEGRHDDDNN